jgi:DNA-binding MarR family transcriptional regulator
VQTGSRTAPAPPTPATRFTDPGFLLGKVGWVARRWIHAALAPIGLNGREAEILLRLRAGGPLTQQQLCEQMRVDPSNLVTMLNRLESEELLSRTRDPADRRRHIVAITGAGLDRRRRADHAVEGVEERLLGRLEPGERASLRRLLLVVDQAAGPEWEDDGETT